MNETLKEIAGMSNDQLNVVITAIKARRTVLASIGVSEFRVGQRVTFESRRGTTVSGIVTRVNQKSVTVKGNTEMIFENNVLRQISTWRVHPSFLRAA